jgi:hypothetical protein
VACKNEQLHNNNNNNIDKTASNASLEAGKLFPETTGLTIAIQDQVNSNNNIRIIRTVFLKNAQKPFYIQRVHVMHLPKAIRPIVTI